MAKKEGGVMGSIILIRGLPGSGKTTAAHAVCRVGERTLYAADDYFYDEAGNYNFDPKLLPLAHKSCQDKTALAMKGGRSMVVHNTFTQRWEMEPYIKLAQEYEYHLIVLSVFDGGCDDEALAARNTHGVPLEGIKAMRGRWEFDWKNGNPTPPWERG